MHFPAQIFYHKPFLSAKWSFCSAGCNHWHNSKPKQRTSALSLISYRCLPECMPSAQHLRKWKMEDRLVDMFRDRRGPRPSEREKGANRYESPLMGQAVCWKIGIPVLISRVRKFGLWKVKLLALSPKAVNGAGIQMESSISPCYFPYTAWTPVGTSEFKLSSVRETAS